MIKIFNKTKNKTGFSFLEVFIVILIIWALAESIPIASFHHSRGPHYADLKHCFNNQRALDGAIGMYNMDNSIMLSNALPGREFDDVMQILKEKKYLTQEITSEDDICSYGFIDLLNKGSVFCVTHGYKDINTKIDENNFPIYPELDSDSECPRLEEYNKLVKEMKTESWKRLQKRLRKINSKKRLKELIHSPAIPLFLLFIIIIYSIYSSVVNAKKKKA